MQYIKNKCTSLVLIYNLIWLLSVSSKFLSLKRDTASCPNPTWCDEKQVKAGVGARQRNRRGREEGEREWETGPKADILSMYPEMTLLGLCYCLNPSQPLDHISVSCSKTNNPTYLSISAPFSPSLLLSASFQWACLCRPIL